LTEPDALPDPSLFDRQLTMLGELAEFGMEQVRALDRCIRKTDPEPSAADLDVAALAYARVSRAVRLTLMLQSKVAEATQIAIADAQAAAGKPERPPPAPPHPFDVRKARVERVVERLAQAEHPDDVDRVLDLAYEASERLDDEDVYGDLLDRPMSEIVARLCKDLGLSPDWSELAQELWAKAEIATGEPGWPLAARAAGAAAGAGPRLALTAGSGWDGAIGNTS
jgi:hypothetical protein